MTFKDNNLSGQKPTKSVFVSIVIITFNSATYVVDTLESIKKQSYANIELLITDDCSTDNTIEVVKKWLLDDGNNRFVRSEVIASEINTGLPANCNRGISAARGEWIKLIAGDDALHDQAIANGVKFIEENPAAEIFASTANFYKNTLKDESLIKTMNLYEDEFFKSSSRQQYLALLRGNRINAGTVFIKKSLINKVGPFIEKYKFIEDYPMWLKVTQNGIKIYYMNALTLKYRVHNNSIYSNGLDTRIFNDFYLKLRKIQEDMVLPHLSVAERLILDFNYYKMVFFDKANINKNIGFSKFLFHLPTKFSSLLRLLRKKTKSV